MSNLQTGAWTRQSEGERSVLLGTIIMLLCVRHVLQLLGLAVIASFLFKVLYITVFLYLVPVFVQKLNQQQRRASFFFLIDLAALFVLGLVLVFNYAEYLESSITFLLAFPILFCGDALRVHRKDAHLFFKMLTLVAFILVLLVFDPSGYRDGILMLYTGNGNQSGLLYMSVFLGIYTYQFLAKNKNNWFLWVLLVGLLYGCWRTESRTAFLACILCVLLSEVLIRNPRWTKRVFLIFMVVFVALPLMVTTLTEWLGDVQFMGSSLWTGREELWPLVLERVVKAPFTMNIDQAISDRFFVGLGAHNVWLDVAWRFTLPIAILFLFAVRRTGRDIVAAVGVDRRGVVVASCLIAGMMHMTFEASLVSGALDYSLYYLLTLFCGAALAREKEVSECSNR